MLNEQKQISKLGQLRDQTFSNEIMLNALSALENLAFYYGYKGKSIFNYYSGYASRNSEKELINAVVLQLEIFRSSHLNYSFVYSNYEFPKNLTKDEIIKFVKEWKKYTPKQIHMFYNEIINYLQGKSNISGISNELERKRKEFGPTSEQDLARVARTAPFVNTHMNKQYDKVKQSYDKTGNYEVTAHLYENQDDDIDMKELNHFDQHFGKQEKQFYQLEKKIETVLYNIIAKMNLKGVDFNSLKNDVELFQNFIIEMNLGENEIIKKVNLYNSYRENIEKNLIGTVDSNLVNFLLQTCEKMIACYSKRNPSSMA